MDPDPRTFKRLEEQFCEGRGPLGWGFGPDPKMFEQVFMMSHSPRQNFKHHSIQDTDSPLTPTPTPPHTPQTKLLNGQKLQGTLTSNEVAEIITRRGWEADYPLFVTIDKIVTGALPPTDIVRYR